MYCCCCCYCYYDCEYYGCCVAATVDQAKTRERLRSNLVSKTSGHSNCSGQTSGLLHSGQTSGLLHSNTAPSGLRRCSSLQTQPAAGEASSGGRQTNKDLVNFEVASTAQQVTSDSAMMLHVFACLDEAPARLELKQRLEQYSLQSCGTKGPSLVQRGLQLVVSVTLPGCQVDSVSENGPTTNSALMLWGGHIANEEFSVKALSDTPPGPACGVVVIADAAAGRNICRFSFCLRISSSKLQMKQADIVMAFESGKTSLVTKLSVRCLPSDAV